MINYTTPTPRIKRITPRTIAIAQQTIPAIEEFLLPCLPVDVAIILRINPTNENGIFSQFNEPSKGIKAITMPIMAKIPQIRQSTCTIAYFI